MKKLLALSLATSLVMSLSMAAFALKEEDKLDYVDDLPRAEEDGVIADKTYGSDTPVGYGETAYFLLRTENGAVASADAVKGVTIKKEWDVGSSLVDSVTIVRKRQKISDAWGNYAYFLAVKLKSSKKVDQADVIGRITLKKSGSDGWSGEKYLDVNLAVGYPYAEDKVITDEEKLFNFSTSGPNQLGTESKDELTIEDVGSFTVNTGGQGKIVLRVDRNYKSDIADRYPDANLDFVNGNGASFNRTGELFLNADEGSYLYQVNGNTLKLVSNAYDDEQGGFVVKTKTLGQYVISDTKLRPASGASSSASSDDGWSDASPSDEPGEPSNTPSYSSRPTSHIPFNPNTGAAA